MMLLLLALMADDACSMYTRPYPEACDGHGITVCEPLRVAGRVVRTARAAFQSNAFCPFDVAGVA